MARKPARLERAGALTPRDRMWAAVRELAPTTFSPLEVVYLANLRGGSLHVHTAMSYLQALSKAAPPYVELADGDRPAGRKRNDLALYRLARDVGVDAPAVTASGKPAHPNRGQEQMWAVMKTLRSFDGAELAVNASTPEHAVTIATVKNYVTALHRAGYLEIDVPSKPGTQARYRFVRAKNTGPRAPLICRDKSVMDANSGAIVWEPSKGDGECQNKT